MSRDILQGNGVGVQLRGGVPVGDSGQMFTLLVYGVNGPGSTQNQHHRLSKYNRPHQRQRQFPQHAFRSSGGGRLGWFYPWAAHEDIELGVSGQSGMWDNNGGKLWSRCRASDAALHLGPTSKPRANT